MNAPDEFARREASITPTILTIHGTYFDFEQPQRSEIDVEMIAHALSNLCRFTGHSRHFYSVAQHAVLVSWLTPPKFAYQGLHHDDAEAFVGDMASPLKKMLPGYKEVEQRVEAEVFRRMGLPAKLAPDVKRADLIALRTEQRDLMNKKGGLWTSLDGIEPAEGLHIEPLPPREAMELFLNRHARLVAEAGASTDPQTHGRICSYPQCNCPFDAPADPHWCARGYGKEHAIRPPRASMTGVEVTYLEAEHAVVCRDPGALRAFGGL